VVVLDAAHGGDDPGGRLDGDQLEKAFTLAFSVRLRSLLTARGIQVVTTREQDVAIDPDRRAAIANHAQAQACLSLHASESGQGVHLYVSSLQPAPPTRLAAWKTAQAGYVQRSLTLAGVLNGALVHAGIKVLAGRVGLPGLDSMTCPAVAIEVAPETSNSGSPAPASATGGLADSDYQARVASALAAALLEWRSEGRQP
jgi:N-acetylmuramoyl-L-alanine amidase